MMENLTWSVREKQYALIVLLTEFQRIFILGHFQTGSVTQFFSVGTDITSHGFVKHYRGIF